MLGRRAGDRELGVAGFGRALGLLDVAAGGGRFAGFGRAVGALDFGVALGAGGLAGFGRAVGVLVPFPGVVRAVGRCTGLGDGLEAVGCSRV